MKLALLALLAIFSINPALAADAAPLASKTIQTENANIKQEILDLYRAEMAKVGSPLETAVTALALAESIPEYGELLEPSAENIFEVSSSKMDNEYYTGYLLAVRGYFDGTAHDTQIIAAIQVDVTEVITLVNEGEPEPKPELTITFTRASKFNWK